MKREFFIREIIKNIQNAVNMLMEDLNYFFGQKKNLVEENNINKEQMKVEIVDLKVLLLAFGLGFIPLKSVYKVKDSSFSLGIEMSVFVPMSPNFIGYRNYPDVGTLTVRNSDFHLLAVDLVRKYNQDSVLIRDEANNNALGLLYQNGKFKIYKEDKKILSDEDIDMYMSQLAKGRKRDEWWTLDEEDLSSVAASLYDGAELEILCG